MSGFAGIAQSVDWADRGAAAMLLERAAEEASDIGTWLVIADQYVGVDLGVEDAARMRELLARAAIGALSARAQLTAVLRLLERGRARE